MCLAAAFVTSNVVFGVLKGYMMMSMNLSRCKARLTIWSSIGHSDNRLIDNNTVIVYLLTL